jgi:hypothetical protein
VNGGDVKIEIFKPFGEAFDLMKRILFQPFDFEKWLVVGFAAFLTHLNGGGGGNFNFPWNGNWNANAQSQGQNIRSFMDQLTPFWLLLIAVIFLVIVAVFVVFTWIRSRGHFIFIDCIVQNRGAIVQPWKEYRVEGNSYFIFSLLLFVCVFASIILMVFVVVLPIFIINPHEHGAIAFSPLALLILIFPLFLLFVSLVQFVAPIMYRRRCTAWPAAIDLLSLIGANLGVFILYVLFSLVLGIAVGIGMVMLMCATCCIAAIPYVGTVILLPIYVFLQSFSLLFIRQFGPEYDVWRSSMPEPPSLPA